MLTIKKREKKAWQNSIFGKNGIEILVFKTLADSYISQDKFVWVNDGLKEFQTLKTAPVN